ncbi:purple acid phosphatase 3-like [Iris pallida]|uniref:Purple acid phosphatase n=1 Tax=Iris pallida TaxID=29817 RepID=A0AAX6EU18_IRIPA|nr:purple acid phosphatase 3-like [Iris pallida]
MAPLGGLFLVLLVAAMASSTVPFSSAALPRFEQPIKSDGSLSLLAVGDWGRNGTFNQSRVAFQMGRIGDDLDVDFVVSLGDNFYEDGLTGVDDKFFEESFTSIYTAKSLQKQWYAKVAQLFFVDTTPFVKKYWKTPNKHHYDWREVAPREKYVSNLLKELDSALSESTATWKIVLGHHTMRSVSDHGDTEELVERLLPILEANGVDLYVNGHDHCLEHISSNDSPIQFITSGGGSKAWRGVFDPTVDKLQFFYDGQGFISLQLTKSHAKIVFYDVFGTVVHQWSAAKNFNFFM